MGASKKPVIPIALGESSDLENVSADGVKCGSRVEKMRARAQMFGVELSNDRWYPHREKYDMTHMQREVDFFG